MKETRILTKNSNKQPKARILPIYFPFILLSLHFTRATKEKQPEKSYVLQRNKIRCFFGKKRENLVNILVAYWANQNYKATFFSFFTEKEKKESKTAHYNIIMRIYTHCSLCKIKIKPCRINCELCE